MGNTMHRDERRCGRTIEKVPSAAGAAGTLPISLDVFLCDILGTLDRSRGTNGYR